MQQVTLPEDCLLLDHTCSLIIEHCVHLELYSKKCMWPLCGHFATLNFPMTLNQIIMWWVGGWGGGSKQYMTLYVTLW